MSIEPRRADRTEHEDWMGELQRRSWELELLVSGFSIFLLLQAPALIDRFAQRRLVALDWQGFASFTLIVVPSAVLRTLVIILALSLINHLLLRGVWIALIGLRSVYEKDVADEDDPSFDPSRTIIRLDNLASLIFSFSFLIVGVVFSFGLFFLVWGALAGSAEVYFRNGRYALGTLFGIPALVLLVSGLIWLLNQLTGGRLAQGKLSAGPYARVDFLLSRLTLSFAYRPIYNMLITRSRWFKLALWTCFAIALVANFKSRTIDGQFWGVHGSSVQPTMYDNLRPKGVYIRNAAIDNDVIGHDVVRLFLVTRRRTLEAARAKCDDFSGFEDSLGYLLFGVSLASSNLEREENEQVVSCLSDQFRIFLDGEELVDLSFLHYRHSQTHQAGLLTYVPLPAATAGLHKLAIQVRIRRDDGSWSFFTVARIPFWRTQ